MNNTNNENETLQSESDLKNLLSEIANLKEEKMTLLAKVENERKVHARDTEEVIKYANRKILMKVLPLLENYERALKVSDSHPNSELSNFMTGFAKVVDYLREGLASEGVSEYAPELRKEVWDSRFCDVIDEVVDDNYEPGIILEVLQKGYLLNGRVLTTAKIVVSKRSAAV